MVGRTNESIFGREQSQRIWGHIFISTIIDKAKTLMEEAREGRAGRVSLELSAAPPQGIPYVPTGIGDPGSRPAALLPWEFTHTVLAEGRGGMCGH